MFDRRGNRAVAVDRGIFPILFLIQLILIVIGSLNSWCTYIATAVSVLAAIYIGRRYYDNPGPNVCNGIITLLAFQNLAIGMGAHLASNTSESLKLLTQVSFITVFVMWVFLVIVKKRSISIHDKWFLALLACIVISPAFGWDGIMPALLTTRNLTVFYMAYQIGMTCIRTDEERECFARYVILIGTVMLFVGVIILVGGYPMYKALGVHEVYIAKAAPFPEGEFPARFHTNMFGSGNISRMGSTYYEPVNLCYYYALAVLVALFNNPYKNKIWKYCSVILMFAGLILSAGKGGYLIVGACLACVTYEWILVRFTGLKGKMIVVTVLVTALVGITGFVIIYTLLFGPTIAPHIEGVIGALKGLIKRPYGYGIGNGGNASFSLGTLKDIDAWIESGGETALMSFAYQIGLQGLVCFLVCLLMTVSQLKKNDFDWEHSAFFYVPFILAGVSILQDNTYAPQCIVPFMLYIGGLRCYGQNS